MYLDNWGGVVSTPTQKNFDNPLDYPYLGFGVVVDTEIYEKNRMHTFCFARLLRESRIISCDVWNYDVT